MPGNKRTAACLAAAAALIGSTLMPGTATAGGPPTPTGKIAFVSERDGNEEIYLMNADGSDQTRVTTNGADDRDPAWSPDGRRLLFESDRTGHSEIFLRIFPTDGRGRTIQLTNTGEDVSNVDPAWAPNGNRFVFASDRDGDLELFSSTVSDPGMVTRLTQNVVPDFDPFFSPSGDRIAFTSIRSGNADIWELNPSNGAFIRRTFSSAIDFGPAYTPDGLSLAFSSNRASSFDIWCVLLAGNRQENDLEASKVSQRPSTNESEPRVFPGGAFVAAEGFVGDSFQVLVFPIGGGPGTPLTTGPERNGEPAPANGAVPQCSDEEDNDADNQSDFPADAGCSDALDDSESPEPPCADGVDNDKDGYIDHPTDPSCDSERDDEGRVITSRTSFTSFTHGSPFSGRIAMTPPRPRCLRHRGIQLYMIRPGKSPDLLSGVITEVDGTFVSPHAAGVHAQEHTFFAKALRDGFFIEDGETFVKCTNGRSENLVVPAN